MFTYLRLACCFLRSAMRPQLVVLARSCRRPRLTPADRLSWTWLSRFWSPWRSALVLVQPVLGGLHHEYEWVAA